MTRFIGDVHGHFGAYKTIIKNYPNTIQVGDLGIGFRNSQGDYTTNPPYDKMVQMNARFIRGNHDNPGVCRNNTQWIADGIIEGDMMFVGGAWSIDKDWRTPGYTWWEDEELSSSDFYKIMDIYEKNKPRIMVTHDCPEMIIPRIMSHHIYYQTRTGQAFDAMFKLYQPKIWVFGHHHKSFDEVIEGTRFICLAELEHREIE